MTLFPLELTHMQLVYAAYDWILKRGGCGVAFKEFKTGASNGEIPDVIGFYSGGSTVIECKVSRSDFLSDKNKMFRRYPEQGMGDHRYYCCPTGLIKAEDLPTGWGLLYVDAFYNVKRIVYPKMKSEHGEYECQFRHPKNLKAEHELMYSALRRLQIRGRIEEVYTDAREALDNQNLEP